MDTLFAWLSGGTPILGIEVPNWLFVIAGMILIFIVSAWADHRRARF